MKKRFSKLLDRGQKRGSVAQDGDSPEATVTRGVKLFCESGGPSATSGGDEVTHLPSIVEAAESSPKAAENAAYAIRKTISQKSANPPNQQYNAIMLLRILVDNPGATFTTHVASEKFVETVRMTCRLSPDPSVQQLLRETLQTFAREKREERDANLKPLMEMWSKEQNIPMPGTKEQSRSYHNNVRNANMPGSQQASGSSGARKLPSPPELASRIEEARTSSKLLIQLTQTTPASEFESHELIKEFADRCNMAYRSLQGFANATEPEPDEETLKTLIETCEQLSLASSKYQRAKLAATRHRKSNTSNVNNGYNNAAGMNVNAQEMPAAEPQNAGADSSGYQYPPEKQGAPQSDGYSSGPSAPPTFSPFTASQYSTGNPFSDENRISMNAPRPQQQSQQQHQQQQYQANSNSFFAAATANNTSNQPSQQHSTFPNRAPQAGSYELPASTASQGYSSHTRGLSSLSNAQGQYGDISDVPPPSGPPPGRTHGSTNHTKAGHVQTASEGSHNELYETSPVATTHPNKPTAVPGSYNELYDTSPVATTHPNKPTAVPGSYNELYDTSPVAATHPNKPTAVPGSYNELYDTSPVATTHPNKPTAVPGSYNELYDTSPVATTHPNKPTAVPGSYNELYDTSPVAPAHNTAHTNQPTGPSSAQHNSSSSAYDDLYSLDQEEPRKPSSPTIPDQDVDGKNAPQSGVGGGGAAAAGAGGGGAGGGAQGRVRDDEPMTPVAGVSGSGWRY